MKNKTPQMSAKGAALISKVVGQGVEQVKSDLHEKFVEEVVSDSVTGAWDDLTSMYSYSCALLLSNQMLDTVLSDPKVVAELKDIPRVNELTAIIARDLTRLSNELAEIGAMHKEHTGDAAIGQLGLIYKITELYNTWKQRYEQVMTPNVIELSAMTEQAERAAIMKTRSAADNLNEDKKEA